MRIDFDSEEVGCALLFWGVIAAVPILLLIVGFIMLAEVFA